MLIISVRLTLKRAVIISALIVVALLVWSFWTPTRVLSPSELSLLGEWGSEIYGEYDALPRGMTRPWLVWDFGRDGVLRKWDASADDPKVRRLRGEGRWSVVDSTLHIDDVPFRQRVVREAWIVASEFTGRLSPWRTHALRFPIRFVRSNAVEFEWQGSPFILERFPPRSVP